MAKKIKPTAPKLKPAKKSLVAKPTAATPAKQSDPQWIYEDVYTKLTTVMDRAPKGEGVELAVLDAVITAAAHFAADSFSDADVAPGLLKCVQLFAERMKETLVVDFDEPITTAEAGLGHVRTVR